MDHRGNTTKQVNLDHFWHHDIQHNDNQYNNIQHNDTQHDDIQYNDTQLNDIQHNRHNCDTLHKHLESLF